MFNPDQLAETIWTEIRIRQSTASPLNSEQFIAIIRKHLDGAAEQCRQEIKTLRATRSQALRDHRELVRRARKWKHSLRQTLDNGDFHSPYAKEVRRKASEAYSIPMLPPNVSDT